MVSPWVPIFIATIAYFGRVLLLPSFREWRARRQHRRLSPLEKLLASCTSSPLRPVSSLTVTTMLPSGIAFLCRNVILANGEHKVAYHVALGMPLRLEALGFMTMDDQFLCHFPFEDGRLVTCVCGGNEMSHHLSKESERKLQQLLASIRRTCGEQQPPPSPGKPSVNTTWN